MISILLSIPILSLVTIIQSAVVSRMPLVQGTADLVMVVIIAWALQRCVKYPWQWALMGGILMDFFSSLPFGVYTLSYLVLSVLAQLMSQRLWKFSFLIQLFLTLLGTMLVHIISTLVLFFQGTSLEILRVLQSITLPSLLLNLMLTLPVYIIMVDFAHQLYPEEVES